MARFSNPFAGFGDRLSQRERTLLTGLGLTALVMMGLVLVVLRGNRIRAAEQEIEDLERGLALLATRGAVYRERLKEKEDRDSRLATEPVLFATLLEEASVRVEGVTASNQEEQTPIDLGGGLRKRSIQFDLQDVTLENLVKYLVALESRPGSVISTQTLLIRSLGTSEDRLNAEVELATWERDAAPAAAPEGGGG
jgi:hypothetical protein